MHDVLIDFKCIILQTYSTQQQKDQLICLTIFACPCNCFTK